MGYGHIKEKLSRKYSVLKEKRKGAVIFGSRAMNLRRNGWHTYDSLKKEEEKIVARRMQLAKKTGMPYNFC